MEPIPTKTVEITDVVPCVGWTEEEVSEMNVIENLLLAIIRKFSQGWPRIDDIRKRLPSQIGIK